MQMPEKPPVTEDNLYDDTGRVRDIDAAREMAKREDWHREVDKDRIFGPRKRERFEREADLNDLGTKVLVEKQAQAAAEEARTERRRKESREYDAFIRRNLNESGVLDEEWRKASPEERELWERAWRRKEQRSPEWALEQRLQALLGKRIASFDVGELGEITLNTEDGSTLSFTSWNARDDEPDYDGVRVARSSHEGA